MKPINLFMALIIGLLFALNGCTENPQSEVQNLTEKEVLGTVSDIFSILDSCELNYPIEAFPKRIDDVAISDSFIYTIGESPNYPVVKFDRSGNFIQYIGKAGKGPGEIPHNYWNKLDAIGNHLAILIRGENRVILYENDAYQREKRFEIFTEGDEMYIKDISFADDNHLLLICKEISRHHVILTDNRIEILQRFYPLPPSASLDIGGQAFYWGVQKTKKGFISHFVYPPNWIEFALTGNQINLLKDFSHVNYRNFPTVDSTLTLEIARKENFDLFDIEYATGKLCWLVKKKDHYIGYYFYYGKQATQSTMPNARKEVFRHIFIAENGKIIFEKAIAPEDSRMLLPYNEHLLKYAFRKRGDDIRVVLYFLKLKPIKKEVL